MSDDNYNWATGGYDNPDWKRETEGNPPHFGSPPWNYEKSNRSQDGPYVDFTGGTNPFQDPRQTVTAEIERTFAVAVKRHGIVAAEGWYRQYCHDVVTDPRMTRKPGVYDRNHRRIGSISQGGIIDV